MTTFNNPTSEEIYKQTYSWNGENVDDTLKRIANDISKIEKDPEYWADQFYEMLDSFKFVAGGRIISNAGTNLTGTTYINCYVDGFIGDDKDSMGGIMDALRRQAFILKSEGGYGFCADVMRPRGCFIGGIGNDSCGAVKMLDMWDTQAFIITEGSNIKKEKKNKKGKIRKGAQMSTMSCFSDSTIILTNIGWINIVDLIKKIDNKENIKAIVEDGFAYDIYSPIVVTNAIHVFIVSVKVIFLFVS